MRPCRVFLFVGFCLCAAEKLPAPKLIEMAHRDAGSPAFAEAVTATLGEASLAKGDAVISEGPDFLWAIDSPSAPRLVIDDGSPVSMTRAGSGSLWIYSGQLKTGTSHGFYYLKDGARFGGKTDVAAYLPDCYQRSGVPQGKLSEKLVHTSKIYPGMQSNYWIYVPAQYDARTPAALMVWQDGQGHINRNGAERTLNVVDNLIHDKKIPMMIVVMIQPGVVGEKAMRSIEYDTVDDTYDRFLRDEILADVGQKYKLRSDSYSRAIGGNSSGGICAFNAAWFHPELFSRVLSRIGSFTSIQWHPGVIEGGNVYPFKIRKEPHRNLRVWLQDGANDHENQFGSWPLQNLQMANSLKMMGYDVHFSFGTGTHTGAQGHAELPLELAWLWRDYDPAKTDQTYTMDETEKQKPMFRVRIVGRE